MTVKKIDDVDEDSDGNQSATLSFFNVECCSFVSFAIVHATLYRCYRCLLFVAVVLVSIRYELDTFCMLIFLLTLLLALHLWI